MDDYYLKFQDFLCLIVIIIDKFVENKSGFGVFVIFIDQKMANLGYFWCILMYLKEDY